MSKSSDFLKKDLAEITTYQSGVAQAAAHRQTDRIVTDFLAKYGLSPMQWFVLGLIYDTGASGCRLSDLARRLGTSLPYITNIVNNLSSGGYVDKASHTSDSRIKLVTIAPIYRKTVSKIETGLRQRLRETLYSEDKISRDELQNYIHVLYKIIN